MKKYKNLGIYDFSDYAEEITGDALFKVNGGAQVANTNQGVANAKVGDTVTRNDGTTVTITQGDINWAQQQIDSSASSGNNAQQQGPASSGSGYNPGGPSETEKKEETPAVQAQKNWTYNPNEPDSDKRFNAKDFNGLHIMTICCDDAKNFEDFASYYTTIGQNGAAGTTVYDGIGLTDKDGNIIHVLKEEKSVENYAEYLNPSYKHKICSPYINTRPELNSTIIENNQEKTEREVFFETETSRYGFISEIGLSKVTSETIINGPALNGEFNLATVNISGMNSPEYKKFGLGFNLISVDGEIGFKVGEKRFTIGTGLGLSISGGFEKTPKSLTVDGSFLIKTHVTVEW